MARKPPSPPRLLFNLKEWLTLEDAARHLSIVFGEEVSVADVLRLAIDKRLILSVDFVNHGTARKGRLVALSECKFNVYPTPLKKRVEIGWCVQRDIPYGELDKLPKDVLDGLTAGDLIVTPAAIAYRPDEFLILEDNIASISGVWDLPMVGGEALDVEHKYQMETDGPSVTLSNLEGAFVERDGVVCQLQDDYEDNEYFPGSKASLALLQEHIREKDVPKDKASDLLAKHAERRKDFLEKRRSGKKSDFYHPAGGLPQDVVYVVRTSALRAFEQSVLNAPTEADRAVSRPEETTLLNIVGALLGLLLGKSPAGKPQSVFKSQSAVIDALLAHNDNKPGISARTLQDKFAAAKRSLDS